MTHPSGRPWRPAAGGRLRRLRAVAIGALLASVAGPSPAPASAAQPAWSQAVSLIRCASVAGPRVVFPAVDPFHSSGQGAILWSGAPADCNTSGSVAPGVGIAEFEPNHTLGAPLALPASHAPRLTGLTAATGTGDGRIVLGGSVGPPADAVGGLSQGPAGGPFTPAAGLGGRSAPIAVTSSYRGDVGIASVSAGGKVELRLEQHGTPRISRPIVLTSGQAGVTGLAINIDYRGDTVVGWIEKGAIYVRVRASTGVVLPTQRVAAGSPSTRLGVLISDDNRAIVAWETDQAGVGNGPATTSTYLTVSTPGIHFGRPHLLERFVDPPGLVPSATGLQLVRLAYEGVVIGWTGLQNGHFVVRTAPVSVNSVRPSTTVSDPSNDGMLSGLATGPRGEVIALWTAAPRIAGRSDPTAEQVVSARGASLPSGVTKFDVPQVIAGPGPLATPNVAIDPVTDVAVAVWRNTGRNPGIDYAVRGSAAPDASIAGRPAAPQAAGPSLSWPWIAGIVLAVVGGLGAGVIGVRRRARRRARDRAWPSRILSASRPDS